MSWQISNLLQMSKNEESAWLGLNDLDVSGFE